MKKHLLFMLLTALSFALSSCGEEESPILFDTESNSNPENIIVEYYSPDPSCVEDMYFITATEQSGDLVLRCTNSNEISVTTTSDDHLSASVSNENLINIHFDEITNIEAPEYSYINVAAKVKSKLQHISISVTRYPTVTR